MRFFLLVFVSLFLAWPSSPPGEPSVASACLDGRLPRSTLVEGLAWGGDHMLGVGLWRHWGCSLAFSTLALPHTFLSASCQPLGSQCGCLTTGALGPGLLIHFSLVCHPPVLEPCCWHCGLSLLFCSQPCFVPYSPGSPGFRGQGIRSTIFHPPWPGLFS